jgi:hypothetical protein
MRKQKLSTKAAADKKKRDLAYALTPARRKKKAHAQRMRNKAGSKANGMDWDHKDGRFKSVKKNRGNDGDGTKSEGKSKYKFKAYAAKRKR